MIYLYWYLGIGAAVLAIVFGAHRLTKEHESESIREILDAVNPERKKLSYRILNNFVAPALAAVAIVVVWPVAIYMKGKETFSKKGSSALQEEREFAVERAHLHQPLTVPQIFIEGVTADEELWSFTAPWQTTWGRKEIRTGYVVVHGGSPAKHFLTMWKEIVDEPDDVKAPHAVGADGTRLSR